MSNRLRGLPPRFRDQVRRERRDNRTAAAAFYEAVVSNDADKVETAILLLNETIGGWPIAMRRIAHLPRANADVRLRFLMFWVEAAHLQNKVGRRTLASGLRVLMGGYDGPPLTIYRGTVMRERRSHSYQFAWTTHIESARTFAEGKVALSREARSHGLSPDDVVLLETVTPPEAILHVRGPELVFYDADDQALFDEGEVIVDPFKLQRVRVVERLPVA